VVALGQWVAAPVDTNCQLRELVDERAESTGGNYGEDGFTGGLMSKPTAIVKRLCQATPTFAAASARQQPPTTVFLLHDPKTRT